MMAKGSFKSMRGRRGDPIPSCPFSDLCLPTHELETLQFFYHSYAEDGRLRKNREYDDGYSTYTHLTRAMAYLLTRSKSLENYLQVATSFRLAARGKSEIAKILASCFAIRTEFRYIKRKEAEEWLLHLYREESGLATYLLAHIQRELSLKVWLLKKAVEARRPCAAAANELGFLMLRGELEGQQSELWFQKARELNPRFIEPRLGLLEGKARVMGDDCRGPSKSGNPGSFVVFGAES